MDVMSGPADTKTPLGVGSSWEFATQWRKPTVLAKNQVGPITLGTFFFRTHSDAWLFVPTADLFA